MPRRAGSPTRIGVISDTHGLLRPEALAALAGSDRLIHAGDVGTPEVLRALEAIAPLTVVRGNNDTGAWARTIREEERLFVGEVAIHVIHDVKALAFRPAAEGVQVVVAGHSHKPAIERRDGVLYLNPGSAGPRRFTLPIAVAELVVAAGGVEARIVRL